MEGPAKKKFRSGSDGDAGEHRDINDLPVEVLIKIFKYCVESNSASSLLSSFYHVCSRWRNIVETTTLWNEIPRDKNMTINMFWFLSKKGLLLNTADLSLHNVRRRDHCKLVQVFQNCPSMKYLRFEGSTINGSVVIDVFKACPKLESVTLTRVLDCFSSVYYSDYFFRIGRRLRCINLDGIYIKNTLCFFDTIAEYCPNLEEIRVAKLKGCMVVFPVEPFQIKCSKLSVMVLHNVEILKKETNRNHGFTNLISLSYNRGIESRELFQLLRGATRLKFLNVGYSPDVELQSICKLPIIDLQIFCVSFSTPSLTLRTIMKAKWPNLEFPCIANKATELPSHILKNLHPDWINYV